ncbi:LTA synthase family protein [Alkalicoccus daliensis]|uniref:Phosphoglycerol transferase MdoB n=1 Tax=Alkalicoccus daliensis TaxID=745820 RepID=A0A1H0K4W9_9BACI|nr:LTA synthase family protein [Alkalicoccus daliensis]SDO50934.1 Phosphoglycerol transferase MdoB [Alkalicoccus daliensis]
MREFIYRHRFMLLCLSLMWLKTVVVSFLTFNLVITHWLEAVIFIVNPLAFLLVIFSLGMLLKPSWQRPYYFIMSLVLTSILYANAVYFREFADIITLPMLVMSGNVGDLSTSIFELIQWWDIIFFLDLVFIGYTMVKKPSALPATRAGLRDSKGKYLAVLVLSALIILLGRVEVGEAETPAHSFDRQHLIKSLGIYNFYFYDVYLHFTTGAQPAFAEREDMDNIQEHLQETHVDPNADFFAKAEDMNVVVVSLESVETMALEQTINGQEVTPFLNELIEDSFYFNNMYDQAGQGKTSDTEFMVNNSLYPLGRGAVFHTHPEIEMTPLPRALSEEGYYNVVFHANSETFYNRNEVYPRLGYDYYFGLDYFDVTDENSVGWGLKDMPFIEQSMPHIEDMEQPFYATFLTLTNHFPYELDPEDYFIDPAETESDIVNRYFPAVRYTDEAVRLLFNRFEEAGLYENTMFILYGDHYGIAESHYEELGSFLDKEIDPYETVKLDRVPLIIHIPGMEEEAETIETVGGHIDIMPTLVNLLGLSQDKHIMFGSDLLAEEREDFAVLRNGSVVTDEVVYTGELCYDAESGEELELGECVEAAERGEDELYYSDQIIYGDLMRFFNEEEM